MVEDLPSVMLVCRNDHSNKEYHLSVKKSGIGYVVDFSYGAIGSTLKSGSKTAFPVTKTEALRMYGRLVSEKVAKGYTPAGTASVFAADVITERISGILPALLNPVEESGVPYYMLSENWFAQEKVDGERRLYHHTDSGEFLGVNREGLYVPSLEKIAGVLVPILPVGSVIDGEQIGDVYYTFDILSEGNISLKDVPAVKRLERLKEILIAGDVDIINSGIRLVPPAVTLIEKQELFDSLKASNKEGVVFKKSDSVYTPGRPNSKGPQIKFKFWDSATCLVTRQNAQRSVSIGVAGDDNIITHVGNVTIPPNKEIPKVGDLIEVRYLYANRAGSLYQPTYIGVRTDKSVADNYETLKFKS